MRPEEATPSSRTSTPLSPLLLQGGSMSLDRGSDDSSNNIIRYLALYKAVDNGELEATKNFLYEHPEALTASLSEEGDTALHIAVLAGHVRIVEELVKRMRPEDLEIKKNDGCTALSFAAIGGITEIAKYLVDKNRHTLCIPNNYSQIPVVVAALHGHRDMVHYLYKETPEQEFNPETKIHGAVLLTTCIFDEFYDIALDLVHLYPQLALAQDTDQDTALLILAQKSSAFPSGAQLAFWQRWIYNCIHIHRDNSFINYSTVSIDITHPAKLGNGRKSTATRASALHKLRSVFWKGLRVILPGFTHLYELKLKHKQAQQLLSCLCGEISRSTSLGQVGGGGELDKIKNAVFEAVKHGIVEFIREMMRHYPEVLWFYDEKDRNIFFIATAERQEKIFSLIYGMGAKKNALATLWDKDCNNILHHAAFLAPSSQLDKVSGAVLQMQRELQWYKEVESIVQPKYKDMPNNYLKTPRTLFTEQHRRLVEEGEKWSKDTAESFTVVAALIVTIMFAAAFTAPGGYDPSGKVLYLHQNSFLIFIISDALSLFSSTTSLLIFSGILTSRYTEEDFLKTLPTKLMIGLFTLFFSIATMMITFGISLVIMLRERIAWVSFPIMLLGSLPVTIFALLQFPLLVEIFFSTYGPGIFDKPNKYFF